MIFSSQLGKIKTASPQEGIAQVANHIRKMQEELEYRLMNLSSDNISEIDAKQTTILLSDGTSLEDGIGGGYTEIQLSVEGIRSTVAAQGQKISQIEQKADGIAATVTDLETGMSHTLRLSADRLSLIDSAGETVQLGSGSINLTGSITWNDLTKDAKADLDGIAEDAADAAFDASEAVDAVEAIANGTYDGGTFINGKNIYSPTIYAQDFSAISNGNNGSFSMFGKYGEKQYHFLKINYYEGDAPQINFASPDGAYARWEFDYTTFSGNVTFTGDVNFTGEVTGNISGGGTTYAVFK